jgi:signal transduction histidine kinase
MKRPIKFGSWFPMLGLRLRTFLRLSLLFALPLCIVMAFSLWRQYLNLREQLFESYSGAVRIFALELENTIKDHAYLADDNPFLVERGAILIENWPDSNRPVDLFMREQFVEQGAEEILYVLPAYEREPTSHFVYAYQSGDLIEWYVFDGSFLEKFTVDIEVLSGSDFLFLFNEDESLAIEHTDVTARSVAKIRDFAKQTHHAGGLTALVERDITRVDERWYVFGRYPLSGLPFTVVYVSPVSVLLEPLLIELGMQIGLLIMVLFGAGLYSLRATREQIKPLRIVERFLEHIARRDFSFVPGMAVRDERRAIFKNLNNLRLKLRKLDRMNAEELADRNAQLEVLNRQKDELLGMAAHDLRNPLGVIGGFSEFLLSDLDELLNADQKKYMGRILSTSRYMLQLVDDLLDVSQIESGRLELHLSHNDLGDSVRSVSGLNEAIAGAKEISIRTDIEAGAKPARLDFNKIEQVLNNLVGNAIKYTQKGGAIVVQLKSTGEQEYTVTVRDNGPGISPEYLKTIFQPFSRTNNRATGNEKSAGLGLYIVRRIVEGHGGSIEVESTVGEGSQFLLRLPGRQALSID